MMKLAVLALCLVAAVVAEPEAEASPDAYYGSYGYGLGYRGYGYGGYYGHGLGYYGKRSADAEPEAKADPYYGYGYGLGHGYYGGHLGYAGLGYGYGHRVIYG